MKISHKVSALVIGSGMVAASLLSAFPAAAQAANHPVCNYRFTANTNIRGGAGTGYVINGVGLKGQTWLSDPLTVSGTWIKGVDIQTGKRGWVTSAGVRVISCGHQL